MMTSARRIPRVVSALRSTAALAGVAVLAAGCSLDGLLKSDELPPDVTDPALTETPEGAMAAYRGAVADFQATFGGLISGGGSGSETGFIAFSGLLSDELRWGLTADFAADMRLLLEGAEDAGGSSAYSRLQRTRSQARHAIGLLTRYAPDRRALAGHAYALQGYTEIFLADLFCSGIPLSTLDFDGDFTYQPGSSTEDVYRHALILFDSALALAADSARFVHLARMGRARALLALGELADAAAAAAQVPDGYRFTLTYSAAGATLSQHFARLETIGTPWRVTVGDREGGNGLDYVSSGDPRTRVTARGTNQRGLTIYHPNKYATNGAGPIELASAVEARLIEAEAALRTGGDWLGILNRLRTTCTDAVSCPTPAPAGSGGVAGLPPLSDPGTEAARVDLLFRERAFWLFLTGHRQGDLRRLIRQYGRTQEQVYPVGAYPGTPGLSYGSDVTVPIPPEERVSNPHFTGCISREA